MPAVSTNVYTRGQLVRVSGSFTSINDDTGQYEQNDPTTITITYRKPDGTLVSKVYGTDIEVKHDGLGLFHMDIQTPLVGEYWFRIEGTGMAEAASEDSFYVESAFPLPVAP